MTDLPVSPAYPNEPSAGATPDTPTIPATSAVPPAMSAQVEAALSAALGTLGRTEQAMRDEGLNKVADVLAQAVTSIQALGADL